MNVQELLSHSDRDRFGYLYGGEVSVRFMPKAHRYKVTGIDGFCPSVTSVSGSADKSGFLIPWALKLMEGRLLQWVEQNDDISRDQLVMEITAAKGESDRVKEEAAHFGSIVHAYAEAFAEAQVGGGDLPEVPEDAPDEVVLGIKAFLDWVASEPTLKFIATEKIVASRKYGYVGMMDAKVSINGKVWATDYKTSKAIYDEAIIQTSGYLEADAEENPAERCDGRLLLHFNKETGECTPHYYEGKEDEAADFEAFTSYLTAKRRMRTLEERSKPKRY